MSIEQQRCPLTKRPCQTPDLCHPPGSCDGKQLVREIVKGYTAIVRSALAGNLELAQNRLDTDNLWIQDLSTRNPIMGVVMAAAKKIIAGS